MGRRTRRFTVEPNVRNEAVSVCGGAQALFDAHLSGSRCVWVLSDLD